LDSDFVLIDTPGQMELFLLHEVGPSFSQEFAKRGATCTLMLFDAALANKPSHVVILKTIGLAAQLRLGLPTIIALNKSDLSSASRASVWLKEPEYLQEDLLDEPGVFSDLASHLASLLEKFSFAKRIPAVSATKGEGLEMIYDLVHEIWCACGDLT
ncbi:MAG: ATP/GTP-binding protein, partial [Thermofilaceae archaeon]